MIHTSLGGSAWRKRKFYCALLNEDINVPPGGLGPYRGIHLKIWPRGCVFNHRFWQIPTHTREGGGVGHFIDTRIIILCSLVPLSLTLCSSPFEISVSAFSQSFFFFSPSMITELALFNFSTSKCSLPCPLRRMRMRITEEILYIVEIEDRYYTE